MRVHVIDKECRSIVTHPSTDDDTVIISGLFSALNSLSENTLESITTNGKHFTFFYYGGLLFVLESSIRLHDPLLFRKQLEKIITVFCEIYGDPIIANNIESFSAIEGFDTIFATALHETFTKKIDELLYPLRNIQALTIEMVKFPVFTHLNCTFSYNATQFPV